MRSTTRRAAQEFGYSLVEVMVAMVILTIAIIPMVGMFDAAIRSADAGGKYDAARTCAVQKLEQAKSLPYETVEDGPRSGVCEPSGFAYEIATRPVGKDLGEGSEDEGLTVVTVTVAWSSASYTISGVVSRW